MRTDSAAFELINVSASKEPRYVVELSFNSENTDLYYLTSHADAALPPGALSVNGVVKNISGTSQSVTPEKALASIGSLDFDSVDESNQITTLQYNKLLLGKGLRGQRARIYVGEKSLAWDDYTLAQTQIVQDVLSTDGAYNYKCDDIQRETRKDIFDTAKTTLTQTVLPGDDVVNVTSTAGFKPLKHGNSYSDAPNQTVYYFKIKDEVIRATGKTASSFTGCTHGALNTKAIKHDVDLTASSDRRTAVEEYVYIELPIPKLIYAIRTGKLIGQTEVLPSTWHLGIDESFVRLSDHTNYGSDIYDTTNDNNGVVVRFEGLKKQDGKTFIEKELLVLMGGFSPVYSDGALGLLPMVRISADAPFVHQFDEDNIISYSSISYDMSNIHNHIEIEWNWLATKEKFTRRNVLIDSDSIARNGLSNPLRFKFRGLYGNRHSTETLGERFNAFRDRYSDPPVRLSVTCLLSTNIVEVGDVVRVKHENIRDYYTGASLDRSFEVQHVAINWIDGTVTFRLFGSAKEAGELASTTAASVINDAWYTSEGKNLATYVGGGYNAATDFEVISGVGHIKASCALTGGNNLNDASTSIYFYDGDLVNDSAVNLSITDNVQLRVKGHFTNNGNILGVGAGHAGGADLKSVNQFSPYTTQGAYTSDLYSRSYNAGVAGFIGPTVSMGGERHDNSTDNAYLKAIAGNRVDGQFTTVPNLTLNYNNNTLKGIPADMRGTSGSSGGNISFKYGAWVYHGWSNWMGGAGGAGGAGLFVVSRGASFGVSGSINLSGADGEAGTFHGNASYSESYGSSSSSVTNTPNHAGGGAGGAPGAVYFAIDGASQTYPELNNIISKYGNTPINGSSRTPSPAVFLKNYPQTSFASNWYPYYLGVGAANVDLSGYKGGSRVSFVIGAEAPEEDADANIIPVPASLSMISGTSTLFANDDGTILPRIKLSWVESGDVRVAGYEVQYKKSSDTVWINQADVIGETESYVWPVYAGEVYDVRVRASDSVRNTSEWLTELNHPVIGKEEPPPNVTGFLATQNGEQVVFKWNNTQIADSGGFEIRYAALGNADYSSAQHLTKAAKGTELTSSAIPPGAYTFFIKERDNGGRFSVKAAAYDLTVTTNYDFIYNNAEHPAWLGQRKGFALQANALIPTATDEAVYTTTEYDLGFNDIVRVRANISASLSNVTKKIVRGSITEPVTKINKAGSITDPVTSINARGTLSYGASGDAINVSLEKASRKEGEYHRGADSIISRGSIAEPVTKIISRGSITEPVTTVNDNGELILFEPWTFGDIDMRHIMFRVKCFPNEQGYLPALLKFSPTIDLLERKERASGLTVAIGGSRFNYAKQFHLPPFVNPQIISSTSLYAIKTNEDVNGFDVRVEDKTGADVGLSSPDEFKYEAAGT